MATNDLMTELQKDNIKLDDDSEKKVVKMLLRNSNSNILVTQLFFINGPTCGYF